MPHVLYLRYAAFTFEGIMTHCDSNTSATISCTQFCVPTSAGVEPMPGDLARHCVGLFRRQRVREAGHLLCQADNYSFEISALMLSGNYYKVNTHY